VKILILTQFCTPEPTFKSVLFAAELRRRGHDVRILTGFSNDPGGQIYPGHRLRRWQRETLDGVPILRVPLFPSRGNSLWGRMFNYLSSAAMSALPLLTGWKPDVVYLSNWVTLGWVSRLNRLIRGVPYVMDVQDLWPDSVFQSGMGQSWMAPPLRALCQSAYRGTARLVTLSPGMPEEMVQRGVSAERVESIYNGCDESALPDSKTSGGEEIPEMAGRLNILCAGNLGTAQGLEAVIDAAAIAGKSNPRIQFVFMGRGVCEQALRERAAAVAPRDTFFLKARSHVNAARVMLRAEVLMVHLAPLPLFELTIPSKTQMYLSVGKPILAAIGKGAAQLVHLAGAGIGCKGGQPNLFAKAALRFSKLPIDVLTAMGAAGKVYYERNLSTRSAVTLWEQAFSKVVIP
jgi:glycosyltransferase involved in cell wall biosynthesis